MVSILKLGELGGIPIMLRFALIAYIRRFLSGSPPTRDTIGFKKVIPEDNIRFAGR
jgi:hypothetical protein